MNKVKLVGFAIGAASLLAFAAPTFAASIPATTVFSGQTQVWGNAGQSVQPTFHVVIPAGEVVHAIRTKVDSQATVCTPIAPVEGAQDADVSVSIELPPNSNPTGYNLTAELFTTATLPQAEAMTGNLACTGASTMAYNGSNVVHVLPVSGSSTGGTIAGSVADQIATAIASIKAYIDSKMPTSTPPTPPTPAVDPICAEFKGDLSMTSQGSQDSYGSLGPVSILQSFLMSKGFDIPLLRTQVAKYGYFGTQTAGAVQAFRNAHTSCN